jgi:membrane protein CcdC involved in cytochrome C biogenesis
MSPTLLVFTTLFGAAVMVAWRMRESRSPVSLRKIIIPPLGMSSGFSMFLYPPTRVPFTWAAVAFLVGVVVFAFPLVRTSRLIIEGGDIVVRRSPAFLWVLLGLVGARFALRSYVQHYVDPLQTGALFFLLAFGAVARWRASMLLEYRQLRARMTAIPATAD